MNTPGDGPQVVLSRNGFFKAAIGGIQGGSGNATSAQGSLAFYTATTSAFNERMRIDSSGRVLIGGQSSHADGYSTPGGNSGENAHYSKLWVQGNTYSTAGDGRITLSSGTAWPAANVALGQIFFSTSWGGDHAAISCYSGGQVGNTDYPGYLRFDTTADGASSPTERMRIESDGKVGIGTNNPAGRLMIEADGGSEDILMINNTRSGSNSTAIQQFKREGTNTGYIANTSSATSYATSQSDRRAKKNFEDWTESVLSHFKDLKPTKFHFTQEDDSDEKNKGYIAQDLVGSFPEAYPLKDSGEDAGRYFFNPSGMVVYLMKAIQELSAEVESLKEKING
jgi:hypothetical protein